MHITPELEEQLNAEQTTDKNADDFSSFSAMLKARYGAGKSCNYEEAYQAYCRDMQANQVAQAVDKVLDGIDAATVREALIEAMNTKNIDGESVANLICYEEIGVVYIIDKTVDMLMQNFIIMPRS